MIMRVLYPSPRGPKTKKRHWLDPVAVPVRVKKKKKKDKKKQKVMMVMMITTMTRDLHQARIFSLMLGFVSQVLHETDLVQDFGYKSK